MKPTAPSGSNFSVFVTTPAVASLCLVRPNTRSLSEEDALQEFAAWIMCVLDTSTATTATTEPLPLQIKRARAEIDDAMMPVENFGAEQPGDRR
jgi:hypothetical protein